MDVLKTGRLQVLIFLSILKDCMTEISVCPKNGILINITCYWVTSTIQVASSADYLCQSDGGRLAVIPNLAVNNEIKNYRDTLGHSGTNYYLGYRDLSANGDYLDIWTGGIQSWSNWASGTFPQPNSKSQQCVTIYGSNGYWWDELCDRYHLALCSNNGSLAEETTIENTNIITMEKITRSSKTQTISTCPCFCEETRKRKINLTRTIKIAEIIRELALVRKSLSSSVRKRTSAEDNRVSAVTVGYIGGIVLTLIFGGIILSDISALITDIKNALIAMKKIWSRLA